MRLGSVPPRYDSRRVRPWPLGSELGSSPVRPKFCSCHQMGRVPPEPFVRARTHIKTLLALLSAVTLACEEAWLTKPWSEPSDHHPGSVSDCLERISYQATLVVPLSVTAAIFP